MCQCDHETCSKACSCRCHAEVEAQSNHAYKLGISAGLEQASGIVMKNAKESFSLGNDHLAKRFRELAEYLAVEAKSQHPRAEVD